MHIHAKHSTLMNNVTYNVMLKVEKCAKLEFTNQKLYSE